MASAIHIVDRIRSGSPLTNLQGTLLAMAGVAVIMLLAWLLHAMHYGVDLTDEGFYFNSISNPWIYPYSATQFGFMYYPLYELVGENIVRLRQASLLITFGLAWAVSWTLLQRAGEDNPASVTGNTLPRAALAAILAVPATTTLILTDLWMPTPSYNTLNFQGFLIATLGVMLARPLLNKASLAGWVLIGVGGWVSFMAKPSSAAMLGVLVLGYLFAARHFNLRMLAVSVVTALALLVASALVIDGSLTGFIERIKNSVMALDMMGARHTQNPFRFDEIAWSVKLKLNLLLTTVFVAVAVYVMGSGHRAGSLLVILASLGMVMAVLAVPMGYYQPAFALFRFHGLQVWGVVIGCVLGLAALAVRHQGNLLPRAGVALALLLLFIPYAYAFGSSNNYWQTAIGVSVFWAMSGAAMLLYSRFSHGGEAKVLLPLSVVLLLLTVASLAASMHRPYRQLKPLLTNTKPIEFAQPGSRLWVNNQFAEYLNQLRSQARTAGFKPGTPVIDLTGHRPGVIYFLGGRAIGQPWLLGGYPGSQSLAYFALDRVTCGEISTAWLLLEEDGPRAFPPEFLSRYGLSVSDDYEAVASASAKHGYRWRGDPEKNMKHRFSSRLLKPENPADAEKRCQLHKRSEPETH